MNHSRGFAFHFEDQLALQLAQSLMHEKKWNKDRRDAHRHKPFVANVARRMKHEALLREFVIKLPDERFKGRALQLETQPGNLLLQQFFVAQVGPISGVHEASVTRAVSSTSPRYAAGNPQNFPRQENPRDLKVTRISHKKTCRLLRFSAACALSPQFVTKPAFDPSPEAKYCAEVFLRTLNERCHE